MVSGKSMKNVISKTQQGTGSATSSPLSVRVGGAALIAIGAYFATNVERCDIGFCSAGIQLHGIETVPLAACPVVVPKKTNKGTKEAKNKNSKNRDSKKRTIEDLVMQHNELGFSAAELIESVARPLESVWSEHRANVTSCEFPSFTASVVNAPNLSQQPLGYTIADAFTNFSSAQASLTHNLTNATTTLFNTTAFAVNATRSIFSCASTTVTNALQKCSVKTHRERAMKAVFSNRVSDNRKVGVALRFATNDAVEKMTQIFSHCPASIPEFGGGVLQKQIAAKFPVAKSHMKTVGPAKKIFTTLVADGWSVEARVVNGLWTDVIVSRGEFDLALKRDKIGLVRAVVDGAMLGEI